MFTINRASEPFEIIVTTIADLNMINYGTVTYATHRKTIDLTVGNKSNTRKFNSDIFQIAAIIIDLGAAIVSTGSAFDLGIAAIGIADIRFTILIDRRSAAQNNTTPIAI